MNHTQSAHIHTLFLFFSLVIVLLLPTIVFSAPPSNNVNLGAEVTSQLGALAGKDGADLGIPIDPRTAIISYVQILLQTASVLCILLIVYSGYMFFIARGDESKVDNAKKTLRYTIIGLIIILAAYSITLIATRIIDASVQGKEYRRVETNVRADVGDIYNVFD